MIGCWFCRPRPPRPTRRHRCRALAARPVPRQPAPTHSTLAWAPSMAPASGSRRRIQRLQDLAGCRRRRACLVTSKYVPVKMLQRTLWQYCAERAFHSSEVFEQILHYNRLFYKYFGRSLHKYYSLYLLVTVHEKLTIHDDPSEKRHYGIQQIILHGMSTTYYRSVSPLMLLSLLKFYLVNEHRLVDCLIYLPLFTTLC